MSLALALNNAVSGLRLNQQAISVLSQNISNVNTPGYSKQLINQSAVYIAGVGSGVKIDDITRQIDKYLQRSVQSQGSVNASSDTTNQYYQRVQSLLGQPGANNSLDSFMTTFFNAVQSLAESPEISSLRSNAVSAGSSLAQQLSGLAGSINDLRFQADGDIADAVSTVNGALDKLYALNKSITQAAALSQSTASLLDARDNAIRTISQYVNISTSYNANGAVSIVGGDSVALLEEGTRYHLTYTQAPSVAVFTSGTATSALQVMTLNDAGQEVGGRATLFSSGVGDQVKTSLSGGSIYALQQIRDQKFTGVLQQLDQLASHVRDSVNAIHNNGSGYPAATTLTGDRLITPSEQYSWSGTVRIAVLKADGTPVQSSYADEAYTGLRPLTLDLARLNSGSGNGKPTMQTIVDEINNYFGAPGNKAQVGNLNNIELASDTTTLPSGSPSLFNFDLDLENISAGQANIFVTGAVVKDDTGTTISGLTQGQPTAALQATGSYTTTLGSADVTISLQSTATVAVGDTIYMNPPSGTVNGISAANLTGYFKVTAVSGSQVTFTAGAAATSSGPVSDAGGITMLPPYDTISTGEQRRTVDKGQLQVDFSANLGSKYYDVTVNVGVVGADGVVHTAPVTYRVANNQVELFNKRYSTTAVGSGGTMVLPNTSQPSMRAILVDANGNELPTVNGKYIEAQATLKLIGGNPNQSYSIAIDEMNSAQLGNPDDLPPDNGSGWGFSHYFGLNNFFDSNDPALTGDTLAGSALNLKVSDRLLQNANLISTGTLAQMSVANAGAKPLYTYARYSGDNTIAQQFAKLNSAVLDFDAAGGLPTTQLSLQSYTSQVLGYVSQKSAEASDNAANAKTLYDGFVSKSDAVSGVNLDEELANTVTLQNAYSATARIVTIVNKMYEDLLQSV
ncbi:MAG: flagellar hook-associated protein FlgK [Pseudomonadota bacterium]